jgi:hypothetical protein
MVAFVLVCLIFLTLSAVGLRLTAILILVFSVDTVGLLLFFRLGFLLLRFLSVELRWGSLLRGGRACVVFGRGVVYLFRHDDRREKKKIKSKRFLRKGQFI